MRNIRFGGQTKIAYTQDRNLHALEVTDLSSSSSRSTARFFNGSKDRPAELINGWTEIDVEKVFGLVGSPNVNFDCVKECTGTDGQVYQQPVNTFRERTKAGYLMTDFALDHVPFSDRPLPFGTRQLVFNLEPGRRTQAIALVAGETRMSYGDLDLRANRLAQHLRARGVGADVPVDAAVGGPSLVIVGSVVTLRDQLRWRG